MALVTGSTAYRAAWEHGGDRALAWRDASAALEGARLTKPVAAAFGRPAELRRFLAKATSGFSLAAGELDGGGGAVLVATGARSSASYGIEVLGVREERARVVVSLRERTPGPGSAAATLTFPYRLIEIAATGKHVEVEWRGRP